MTTLVARLRSGRRSFRRFWRSRHLRCAPAGAQQPTSVNLSANAVKEEQLLQQSNQHSRPRHHSGHPVLHDRAAGRPGLAPFP